MTILDFLSRCDAFAKKRGVSRSRLSTLIFNDGKKLDALAAGHDVGVRRLAAAVDRLADLEKIHASNLGRSATSVTKTTGARI